MASFDATTFLKTLTTKPGVYRMLDDKGAVIYVGKAANIKNRVASYFRATGLSPKTRALVAHIQGIDVTVTHSEGEALLLENNLIKELKPRYNILLRDDKSYPYIYLSEHEDFPRLGFYRGARREKGRFFGPYPSAGAVRDSLHLLQKIFPVRQCEDSFYRNRSRPCLQYQIKRCTGPCVGLVDKDTYQQHVRHAVMFLEGKNHEVINELAARMESAAAQLDFERAAHLRDQVVSLRRVQEKQYVSGEGGDLDVVASAVHNGAGCVQVFYIRGGRSLGNKTFFPRHNANANVSADAAEILAAFLPQYYLDRETPSEILISHELEDAMLLESVLGQQARRKVTITHRVRGERARWLAMAVTNAKHALVQHIAGKVGMRQRYEALQEALDLDSLPQRLECFDISHTMGELPVASCVVFDGNGPLKSDYRRFNIENITPGDDYAAMHQALTRRYTRIKAGEGKLPDILFIDGGKGQVSAVAQALEELQVSGVTLVGVAKGPARKPGLETLFLFGSEAPIILPADSPALHLVQQIRDEAHRFAITGHRQRRAKARNTSPLEKIPGIGARRRRQLLNQFGGMQGVARAGVEDLTNVQGISKQLAQLIYDAFHADNN